MQIASAEFTDAVDRGAVTWVGPQLLADWQDDGAEVATSRARFTVDRFQDRTLDSTWGSPWPYVQSYVQVGGANADYTISADGYGLHRHAVRGENRATMVLAGTSVLTAVGVWSIPAALTGTGESLIEVVARDDGASTNRYALRWEVDHADASVDVVIVEVLAGVANAVAFEVNHFTLQVNHEYAGKIQVTEDTVRVKVWDQSIEAEPLEWLLEADAAAYTASVAYAGARTSLVNTSTNPLPYYFKWHSLRVIDGTIDDLSDLAGTVTISHGMDDGLPAEVTYAQDSPTPQLTAAIVDGRLMSAAKYLSPHNPDSPLYGLERDVAPVTLDHGVITANGPETVRLFQGRMVDIPLAGDKKGQLVATSATRLKLSNLVLPPAFNRRGDLSATWPVSWAAYQCGVYAAPNPPDNALWYAPLHGSLIPFLDFRSPTLVYYPIVFPVLFAGFYRDVGNGELETVTYGDDPERAPAYIDGPYVAAPDLQYTSELAWGVYYDFPAFAFPADGDLGYVLSEDGPRGRFEFTVRGDDFDTTGPSGTDFTPTTFILGFFMENDSTGKIYCGINMSRQLRIEMSDGTASINQNASADFDLPADGQWYKYGVAWDFVAEAAYFYMREPDGTEHTQTVTNSSLDVTRLPDGDSPFATIQPFNTPILSGFLDPYFHSFLPCAELHISGGLNANPNNAPWIWSDSYGFEASAIIKRSANRLRAIAEPTEREAWEYISSWAQAEMASMRIDERDRLLYLTPGYWVEDDQQSVQTFLDTTTNVGSLAPQSDPTKIRNTIRVAYREAKLDSLYNSLYSSREVLVIPPGETFIVFALDVLATSIDTSGATLPTSTEVDNGVSSFISGGMHTFFTINTAADGTGSYYSGPTNPSTDPVYIEAEDEFTASTVVVRVINRTGITLYTANDNPEVPTINIGGIGLYLLDASVTESRARSVAQRGARGLTVDAPQIQREDDARRLVRRLIGELAEPAPTLEGVRLFGDQRRQPGDLMLFTDERETGVSGLWRILGLRHVISEDQYYQEARLKKARIVGEWQTSGDSRWGTALWGREGL